MTSGVRILALAGSRRAGSYNELLLRAAARGAENEAVAVSYLDWQDYSMPLFDDDQDEPVPATVLAFREQLKAHQGLLVSCPEYNSSLTPLLKNAIDWSSQALPDEPPHFCFRNKVVALLSASPGRLGGLRGLGHVRDIFTHLGATVLAEQYALPQASRAFDNDGELIDPDSRAAAEAIGTRLATIVKIWS